MVHFTYGKRLLHMKASAPKVMEYGELCIFPMQIFIKRWMVSCWAKTLYGKMIDLVQRLHQEIEVVVSFGIVSLILLTISHWNMGV